MTNKDGRMRTPSAGDIAAWKRRKIIYERRQRGEKQKAIAQDLGVSVGRIADLEQYWSDLLRGYENGQPWCVGMYKALCEAGVIMPERSVNYGYA